MTIRDFANSKGVTVQAVYARMKGAGLATTDLQEGDSKELSTEGIKILEGLYLKERQEDTGKIRQLNL